MKISLSAFLIIVEHWPANDRRVNILHKYKQLKVLWAKGKLQQHTHTHTHTALKTWSMMADMSRVLKALVPYNNPVPAPAFCSARVNTHSISVSGNSHVASWQNFWAEWKSIVWGYMYLRVCVCLSVRVCLCVCACVHFLKSKYWLNNQQTVLFW